MIRTFIRDFHRKLYLSWHRYEVATCLFQLVLYTLQGIPMGLSASIPIILVSNNVSISELGRFSIVSLPFSLKILWAPIVDCFSPPIMGRRKGWLIPTQVICGVIMCLFGYESWWDGDEVKTSLIDQWLEPADGTLPDIGALSSLFMVLYLLMATQDIVVDGWAVEMLSPANRGLASTMNTIGQGLGVLLGNSLFLALRDSRTMGLSLGGFTGHCGVVMIVLSVLIFFKKETVPSSNDFSDEYDVFGESSVAKIKNAYRCVVRLGSLPVVLRLGVALLCIRLPFACVEQLTSLELIRVGFSKELMALTSPFIMVLHSLVPLVVAGRTIDLSTSEKIMAWAKGYRKRLLTIPASVSLVLVMEWYFREDEKGAEKNPALAIAVYLLYEVFRTYFSSFMFLVQMAIFNEVADPKIGAIYMTFLNTLSNLGGMVTSALVYPALSLMPMQDRLDPFLSISLLSLAIGAAGALPLRLGMQQLSSAPASSWKISLDFDEPGPTKGSIEMPESPPRMDDPSVDYQSQESIELQSPGASGSESSPMRRAIRVQ